MKVLKIPKGVDLFENPDGTWTVHLFGLRRAFIGTYAQAVNWIMRNA